MSAIERRFFEIGAVVLFSTALLPLFLDQVVGSSRYSARARDTGGFWAAGLWLAQRWWDGIWMTSQRG